MDNIPTLKKSPIAVKLKNLRKSIGYTQQFVADYLGIIRQTYSHYETDRLMPNMEVLCKLADLYRISPEILLDLVVPADLNKNKKITDEEVELTEYLTFTNDPKNRIKYKDCSVMEKRLLFRFSMLSTVEKNHLIDIAKVLASTNTSQ